MAEYKKFTAEEKNMAHEVFENIFKILYKTTIRFVGSNLYRPFNGWQSEQSDDNLLIVIQMVENNKAKEFIVEGDEFVINELKTITGEYAWGLSFEEATEFLNKNGISWELIFEKDAPLL